MKTNYKPGQGWKFLGSGVYEYLDGRRLHVLGLCKLPDGRHVSATASEGYLLSIRMIRINGGNRKRGLMAWARQL